jgi:hypothetical protein
MLQANIHKIFIVLLKCFLRLFPRTFRCIMLSVAENVYLSRIGCHATGLMKRLREPRAACGLQVVNLLFECCNHERIVLKLCTGDWGYNFRQLLVGTIVHSVIKFLLQLRVFVSFRFILIALIANSRGFISFDLFCVRTN